jgi:hypothetical protein
MWIEPSQPRTRKEYQRDGRSAIIFFQFRHFSCRRVSIDGWTDPIVDVVPEYQRVATRFHPLRRPRPAQRGEWKIRR